jgi:hypothetical protein
MLDEKFNISEKISSDVRFFGSENFSNDLLSSFAMF